MIQETALTSHMERANCEYSVQVKSYCYIIIYLALSYLEAFTTLILTAYFLCISGDCDFETHDKMC